MAILKNREVVFNRFVSGDDRRVSVTNKDGTTSVVNLMELRFTEEEKKDFEKQNAVSVNVINDKDLKELRDSQAVSKEDAQKKEDERQRQLNLQNPNSVHAKPISDQNVPATQKQTQVSDKNTNLPPKQLNVPAKQMVPTKRAMA